ncbi:MAG: ferritin family protein [bacterium]
MDIFDFAMQMEKDGEAYYRELAQKCGDKGLARIFTMLADEEVKHYRIFSRMKKGKVEVPPTTILSDVKNIFAQMKEKGEQLAVSADQIALYRKAQEIEKKSEDFYGEKAAEVREPGQKESFLKIADEEKKHFLILEGIIEFVQRPQRWLEDAEWSNIGREY